MLNSIILLGLVIGLAIIIARLGRVANAAEKLLKDVGQELPPTLNAARDALRNLEALAAKSEQKLDTVDDVLRSVNRLVSGIAVAEVAAKAITSSKVTVVSVIAGVREALRALKRPSDETKEA